MYGTVLQVVNRLYKSTDKYLNWKNHRYDSIYWICFLRAYHSVWVKVNILEIVRYNCFVTYVRTFDCFSDSLIDESCPNSEIKTTMGNSSTVPTYVCIFLITCCGGTNLSKLAIRWTKAISGNFISQGFQKYFQSSIIHILIFNYRWIKPVDDALQVSYPVWWSVK